MLNAVHTIVKLLIDIGVNWPYFAVSAEKYVIIILILTDNLKKAFILLRSFNRDGCYIQGKLFLKCYQCSWISAVG